MTPLRPALCSTLILLLAACASGPPPRNAELEDARTVFTQASNHPGAARASVEVDRARQSLTQAESDWARSKDPEATHQAAYLARRQAEIALAAATQAGNEQRIAQAGAERERLLLTARTREADQARSGARSAQNQALQAQNQAAQAQRQAETARQQAAAETERATALQQDLAALQARNTERGLVVTLGDVLFATGRAELQPGAQRSVERIAAVLQQHAERRVLVEGFTDSVGNEETNLALSQRRAEAFAHALAEQGIAADRIEVRAHGEALPVADNGSAAGRQQNRRVEVLFSDAQGRLVTR